MINKSHKLTHVQRVNRTPIRLCSHSIYDETSYYYYYYFHCTVMKFGGSRSLQCPTTSWSVAQDTKTKKTEELRSTILWSVKLQRQPLKLNWSIRLHNERQCISKTSTQPDVRYRGRQSVTTSAVGILHAVRVECLQSSRVLSTSGQHLHRKKKYTLQARFKEDSLHNTTRQSAGKHSATPLEKKAKIYHRNGHGVLYTSIIFRKITEFLIDARTSCSVYKRNIPCTNWKKNVVSWHICCRKRKWTDFFQ